MTVPGKLRAPAALAAIGVAFFVSSSPAWSADLEAGKRKVNEVCQACHGMDGNSPIPDYPKLAGQYLDYLAKSLRDYKSGARKNAIMQGMVGTLSERDIDNIAAYYAPSPRCCNRGCSVRPLQRARARQSR